MIIGNHFLLFAFPIQFFSILEGGLHARNLRIFACLYYAIFPEFLSTENCALSAESLGFVSVNLKMRQI